MTLIGIFLTIIIMQLMHVSIAVTRIIIICFVVAAHAARTLTVQEAQVSETGSGQELRQLPRLGPGEEEGGNCQPVFISLVPHAF